MDKERKRAPMDDTPDGQPNAFKFKEPEAVAAGVYATAMVVSHTREEFFLDFIASYAIPSRLATRVILNPAHTKRLLKTLRDNLDLYRKNFGPLPEPPPDLQQPGTVQAQSLYAQLTIPDSVLGGSYANNVLIRHTREEFILDFLVICHPSPVLTARVLVNPAHIQRIANVLKTQVQAYENSFGPLKELPPPPEPPERWQRFSLS
jgi:hypothetical protein